MATLKEIDGFCEDLLNVNSIPDYSGAHNGVQLENSGDIKVVAAAVDASEAVIAKAVAAGADLLVVHHGMFWQGAQMLTGAFYRKIKLAMENNLAVYSSHIPLDVHANIGNNALFAKSIGMNEAEPYGDWKGIPLGLKQTMDISLGVLLARVDAAVGSKVHVCPGYGDSVGVVGVVTGGAGSEVEQMAKRGVNTFITGEGPHWSYPLAEELGVNLIYAGHYATETFGVKALARSLHEAGLCEEVLFVDHPTGL